MSPDSTSLHYSLPSKHQIEVFSNIIVIRDGQGREVARNSHIIRRRDENGTCPSEGFISITSIPRGFVVHQQNCGGWTFVEETVTFTRTDNDFLVERIELMYVDRRDQEAASETRQFNVKDFRRVSVRDVDLNALEQEMYFATTVRPRKPE